MIVLVFLFLYLFIDIFLYFFFGGFDMKDFNKDRVKIVVVSYRGIGDFRII